MLTWFTSYFCLPDLTSYFCLSDLHRISVYLILHFISVNRIYVVFLFSGFKSYFCLPDLQRIFFVYMIYIVFLFTWFTSYFCLHLSDYFEYPQQRVCFNNTRKIVGKRPEHRSLSWPLIYPFSHSTNLQQTTLKILSKNYLNSLKNNYRIKLKTFFQTEILLISLQKMTFLDPSKL